jgi:hypothetical protein
MALRPKLAEFLLTFAFLNHLAKLREIGSTCQVFSISDDSDQFN